jgi:hypothetical protein
MKFMYWCTTCSLSVPNVGFKNDLQQLKIFGFCWSTYRKLVPQMCSKHYWRHVMTRVSPPRHLWRMKTQNMNLDYSRKLCFVARPIRLLCCIWFRIMALAKWWLLCICCRKCSLPLLKWARNITFANSKISCFGDRPKVHLRWLRFRNMPRAVKKLLW